jgi:transcriptional regulator with XRE-family HTH domain
MSTTFAPRLNRLFDTVYPPGRGPHSSAEVVAALRAQGISFSAPYLSQLRSGARDHPSEATITALAEFFRVDPAYFTDDEYFSKLDEELELLAALRDVNIQRIASRMVGLSPTAQQDVATTVEQLRRKEHLV